LQEALRPQPVMASVQSGEGRAATQPKAGERPSAKVLPSSQSIECTAFEYAEAVWEGHFLFWNVVSMPIGWVWLVWAEDMGWFAASVVIMVAWVLGCLLLVFAHRIGVAGRAQRLARRREALTRRALAGSRKHPRRRSERGARCRSRACRKGPTPTRLFRLAGSAVAGPLDRLGLGR
jgi:hypothetical protein